jgi:hypothetical protein
VNRRNELIEQEKELKKELDQDLDQMIDRIRKIGLFTIAGTFSLLVLRNLLKPGQKKTKKFRWLNLIKPSIGLLLPYLIESQNKKVISKAKKAD